MNMTHWLPVSTIVTVAGHLPCALMLMGRLRLRLQTGQPFSSMLVTLACTHTHTHPASLSLLICTAPAAMVLTVEGGRSGFEEGEAWTQSVSLWAWAVRTQLEIASEVPVQSS